MIETVKKNTIYTNVVLKYDKTVWWEGFDGEVPQEGVDWQGRFWKPGMRDSEGNLIK